MSEIFKELNDSFQQSEISNKFKSVKDILNDEQLIINPDYESYEISNKFKGIILMETYNKLPQMANIHTKSQKQFQKIMKHRLFSKWYINSSSKIEKTIDKILVRQQISRDSFLYRIKTSIKATYHNRDLLENVQGSKNKCLSMIPIPKNPKKKSILKNNERSISKKSHTLKIAETFKQLGIDVSMQNLASQKQKGSGINSFRSKSSRKFTNQSLKQLIQEKVYKSSDKIPSLDHIVQNINNKRKQKGANNEQVPALFPYRSFRSKSQVNSRQFSLGKKSCSLGNIVKIIQKVINLKICSAWFKIKQNTKTDEDFQTALIIARRNLELVEINFQVQNQIQQINDNYSEQVQRLQLISDKIQNFQANINYSRSLFLLNALRKIIYPQMRPFFESFKEKFYPIVLEERQKDKYKIIQMASGSICSQNQSEHRIQFTGFQSLNSIMQEDILRL